MKMIEGLRELIKLLNIKNKKGIDPFKIHIWIGFVFSNIVFITLSLIFYLLYKEIFDPVYEDFSIILILILMDSILVSSAFIYVFHQLIINNKYILNKFEDSKQNLIKLEESEKRYKSIYFNTPVMMHSLDMDNKIVDVNIKWLQETGYSRKEVVGKKITDFMTDESRELAKTKFFPLFWEQGHIKDVAYDLICKDGSIINVLFNCDLASHVFGEKITLSVVYNITNQVEVEKKIKRRDTLLEAVASASNELLSTHNLDESINNVLEILGNATDADRVVIFKYQKGDKYDNSTISYSYEWKIDRIEPEIDNPALKNLPFTMLGQKIYETFTKRKPFYSIVKDIDDELLRDFLTNYGMLSLLLVPIFVDDKFWGFIGFDDFTSPRVWNKSEVSLLEAVSQSIASAVIRSQIIDELEENRENLEKRVIQRTIEISKANEELKASIEENDIIANQLEEERNQLLAIFDSIEHVIYVADLDNYEILYINDYTKQLFGDDLIGRKCFEVFHDELSTCKFCKNDKLKSSENNTIFYEFFNQKISKHVRIMDKIIKWKDGRKVKLELAIDVTKSKEAEQELSRIIDELEFQTKALDEAATLDISDHEGKIIYVNDKFLDTFGYSRKEIYGDDHRMITSKQNRNDLFKDINKTIYNGEVWKGEVRYTTKYGKDIWADTTIVPFMDKNGVTKQVTIINDVTDYKMLLEEQRKLFRAVEQSPASIVVTNKDAIIEYVNPFFTKLTGYTKEEAIGKNPRILQSGLIEDQVYKDLWDTITSGKEWKGNLLNKKKNGELFWEAVSISPVFNDNDEITHYVAIKEDVTYKKEAEIKLEKSNSLYRTTLDAINEGVIAFDLGGRINSYNNRFLKLFDLNDDSIAFYKTNFDLFEFLSSKVMDSDGFFYRMKQIIESNNEEEAEVLYLKNENVYELSRKPQRLSGSIIGYVWSFRDVTKRNKAEDKLLWYTKDLEFAKLSLEEQKFKLEETVDELKAAKNEAEMATKTKSEFLANMSHEIRTPMNAILGFTQLLEEGNLSQKQRTYLNAITSSGKNLLRLINDILDLSKIEAGKLELSPEVVNIKKVITEIKDIFIVKAEEKEIDLIIDITDNIHENLYLDEVRLRQILFNLVGNSIKFTEDGFIRIGIRTQAIDENDSVVDLTIEVEDTGIGISEDQQDEIFESFRQQSGQSTRKFGGTGLGLAITKRLVEMMHGEIKLKSMKDEGTVFSIVIKDVEVDNSQSSYEIIDESKVNVKNVLFSKSKVLVVDDILVNRILIKSYLEDYDFEIFEATNGKEAITEAAKNKPDLILMDIKMPLMNGYDAANEIRKMDDLKNTKIIALTASVFFDKDFNEDKVSSFDGFLTKPILKESLIVNLMEHISNKNQDDKDLIQKDTLLQEDEIEIDGMDEIAPEKMKTIIDVLKNEMMFIWEDNRKTGIVEKIKEFASHIEVIGADNNINILKKYGNKLFTEANEFDFERFPRTLDKYPEIITMLEEAFNKKI
jgi:PAS domain S-box-containing protein